MESRKRVFPVVLILVAVILVGVLFYLNMDNDDTIVFTVHSIEPIEEKLYRSTDFSKTMVHGGYVLTVVKDNGEKEILKDIITFRDFLSDKSSIYQTVKVGESYEAKVAYTLFSPVSVIPLRDVISLRQIN